MNNHVTVFPQTCILTFVASASCRCFNTCDPAVQLSLYSCPYRKYGLFVDINLQQSEGLVPHELTTMVEVFKEFLQQQMEGCSGFVFSEDLYT